MSTEEPWDLVRLALGSLAGESWRVKQAGSRRNAPRSQKGRNAIFGVDSVENQLNQLRTSRELVELVENQLKIS